MPKQKKNSPLVSVVALCFNHAPYVIECLNSIKRQTYTPIELIIIDDCSTDESVAIIDQWIAENHYKCKFIARERNGGICKALNQALSLLNGEFVSIIATDDLWMENKIEQQIKIFLDSPEKNIGVVYSDAYQIDEKGKLLDTLFISTYRPFLKDFEENLFSTLLKGNFIPAPSTLIKRTCYDKVGVYDEELCYEDYDMWLRIAQHYDFAYSQIIHTKYRVLGNSLSRRMHHQLSLARYESDFKIYRKCLQSPNLSSQDLHLLTTLISDCVETLHEKQSPRILEHLTYMMKICPRVQTRVYLFLSRLRTPPKKQKTIVNYLQSIKKLLFFK